MLIWIKLRNFACNFATSWLRKAMYFDTCENTWTLFMKYTHNLTNEDNWPLIGAPSATWWATNRTAGWKCLVPSRANSQAVELSALLSSGSLTSGLNTPVPRLSLSSRACTFVWDWRQTSLLRSWSAVKYSLLREFFFFFKRSLSGKQVWSCKIDYDNLEMIKVAGYSFQHISLQFPTSSL